MKAHLLLAALVSMTAASAQAQSQTNTATLQTNVARTKKASTFKIIPTLGVSSGFVDMSDRPDGVRSEAQGGANGGVLLEMGKGWVTWQSGLLYLQEGVRFSTYTWDVQALTFSSYDATSSGHLGYIAIPALVKVNFPPHPRSARFSMKSGLMPAFLTSVKVKSEAKSTVNDKTTTTSGEYTSRDGLRSVNLMALFGIAGEFPIGGDNDIRIEGQYNRGVLPVQENTGGTSMYTQSVMLNIGMGFGL